MRTEKILMVSFELVYLTTPLYVLEIANETNLVIRITAKSMGRFFASVSGIVVKSNRSANARNSEKAQIRVSSSRISQRGILYCQNKLKSLYILRKNTYFFRSVNRRNLTFGA